MAFVVLHPYVNVERKNSVVGAYVFLYVSELSSLFESFHIVIQIFQPVIDDWVIMSYCANIALEVAHINRIKSYNGWISEEIKFSKSLA